MTRHDHDNQSLSDIFLDVVRSEWGLGYGTPDKAGSPHIHDRSNATDIARHFTSRTDMVSGHECNAILECPTQGMLSMRSTSSKFIETQDGAPLTALYIPAVDYVRQDFQRGTLARAAHAEAARRRAHRMHIAKHAALALAIGAAMWGLWG